MEFNDLYRIKNVLQSFIAVCPASVLLVDGVVVRVRVLGALEEGQRVNWVCWRGVLLC